MESWKNGKRPLEIGWFGFYIGLPLKRAGRTVRKAANRVAERVTGRWWCYGCHKHHSGRVVAFWPDGGISDGCCSRHLTVAEMARCEAITIGGFGGRDITARVKREIAGGADGGKE